MNESPNSPVVYRYDRFPQPFTCDISTSMTAGNSEFHMHNRYEIYFLIDGHLQYFVENVCYPLEPGSLILFSTNEIHKAVNSSGQPFTRLVIHLHPDFVRQYCTPTTNLLACFHRKPGVSNLVPLSGAQQKKLLSMARETRQAMQRPGEYGSDLLAAASILQILIFINQAWQKAAPAPAAPIPRHTQAVMDYIDAHLSSPMTLDSIARALSMDKYYLSHTFKLQTQSTIFQYILVRRVALAKSLLAQGYTVAETCHLSGFNDYSNFIRTFKKVTGATPGKFRRPL